MHTVISIYPVGKLWSEEFQEKKPAQKELKPNPTLIVGDVVCMHKYHSLPTVNLFFYFFLNFFIFIFYCRLAQWSQPVNPCTSYHRERKKKNVWHKGYTRLV